MFCVRRTTDRFNKRDSSTMIAATREYTKQLSLSTNPNKMKEFEELQSGQWTDGDEDRQKKTRVRMLSSSLSRSSFSPSSIATWSSSNSFILFGFVDSDGSFSCNGTSSMVSSSVAAIVVELLSLLNQSVVVLLTPEQLYMLRDCRYTVRHEARVSEQRGAALSHSSESTAPCARNDA